jgi:hypothetical protein
MDATETISLPPYKFTYDRTVTGKDKLPHRVSFAQDHWGYYNGKDNNVSLNPPYNGQFGTSDPYFDAFQSLCYEETSSVINVTAYTGDRTPSFPHMQAGTLISIDYPSGGHTDFEYEPHHGVYEDELRIVTYTGMVGGLRIKSITNFDNCNNVLGKKEYEYDEGGLANFPKYRTYEYYNENQPSLFQLCRHPTEVFDNHLVLMINSSTFTQSGVTKGSNVGYQRVKEFERGNGSTYYTYTSPLGIDYSDVDENVLKYIYFNLASDPNLPYPSQYETAMNGYSSSTWPYNPRKNNDWKRGLLLEKDVRDESGKLLATESYHYEFNELGVVPAICIRPVRSDMDYIYAEYQMPYGWASLHDKVVTQYIDGSIAQQLTTQFEYEPIFKYKRSETSLSSKLEPIKTEYKYPFDYTTAPYTDMVVKHIISPIIETTLYKNGVALKKSNTVYKDWFSDHTVIAPELSQTQLKSGPVETRFRYISRDINGNVLSMSKENDMHISYIWDAERINPIAEIKNADPQDIAYTSFEGNSTGGWSFTPNTITDPGALTGTSYHNLTSGNSLSKSGLNSSEHYIVSYWSKNGSYNVNGAAATEGIGSGGWTHFTHEVNGASMVSIVGNGGLDEVRIYPKTAQMTTYCYESGVGLRSLSDLNSNLNFYSYDGLGRLKNIFDTKKNIIRQNEYVYSQSTDSCNQIVYYNDEKSQDYIKSNCLQGHGLSLNYKVSAKTFSSNVSLSDANQKAQLLLDTYGQANANNLGACDLYYHSQHISGYYSPNAPCSSGYFPYQVYLDVPYDAYRSTVSQQDADNQAVAYAQSYANQHACVPGVTITSSNIYNIPYFKVKFASVGSSTVYEYDMPVFGGVVGQIPPGAYNVTISYEFNTTEHTFEAGGYSMTGLEGSFYNIEINADHPTIAIY